MKDGARDEQSSYRLHLWHSMISSYLVIHSFLYPGRYPEYAVIACSLSYFLVDLNHMVFNDLIYRVGGYQKKSARAMEYFHHILSIGATGTAAFNITSVCDMGAMRAAFDTGPMNPLLRFALADVSTPFLMLWRRGGQQSTLWYTIFVILFIMVRIVYHGFYFVPAMYDVCPNERVQYGLIAYQAVQVVSLYVHVSVPVPVPSRICLVFASAFASEYFPLTNPRSHLPPHPTPSHTVPHCRYFVLGKWWDMLSGKAQKDARLKEKEKEKAAAAAAAVAAAVEAEAAAEVVEVEEEEDKKTK